MWELDSASSAAYHYLSQPHPDCPPYCSSFLSICFVDSTQLFPKLNPHLGSHGQLVSDGLSFFHGFEVVIQEVNVESCLKYGGQRLGPAEVVFVLVAVDPS